MKENLEKIIKLSLNQGKDWEEIEQIVLKKSIVLGISNEDCKLILESNKPLPQEELNEEETSKKKSITIEIDYENIFKLYKSLILLQLKIFGWMISYGKLIKTKDLIDEWNKLNSQLMKI